MLVACVKTHCFRDPYADALMPDRLYSILSQKQASSVSKCYAHL